MILDLELDHAIAEDRRRRRLARATLAAFLVASVVFGGLLVFAGYVAGLDHWLGP